MSRRYFALGFGPALCEPRGRAHFSVSTVDLPPRVPPRRQMIVRGLGLAWRLPTGGAVQAWQPRAVLIDERHAPTVGAPALRKALVGFVIHELFGSPVHAPELITDERPDFAIRVFGRVHFSVESRRRALVELAGAVYVTTP